MRALVHRLDRLLRSRRLAVASIGLLAAYSVLGTLVPRGPAESDAVTVWADAHPLAEALARLIGLHHAYTSWPFVVLVTLLVASTTACAIERTSRARTVARGLKTPSNAALAALRDRPLHVSRVASGLDSDVALKAAGAGLARLGLRMTCGPDRVDAHSRVLGLFGSPVFHWSLVGLMLAVAAGQLTRSEGYLALQVGERVAESHADYLEVVEGPLFGERHTGIELEAREVDRDYQSGGIDYGPVPYVAAYREGLEIGAGHVHPNSPLKVGTLTVHMVELGPAVTIAIEVAGSGEIAREVFTLDPSDETSSGTDPQTFEFVPTAGGEPVSVRVQVVTHGPQEPGSPNQAGRVILETSTVDAVDYGTPVVLAETEAVNLTPVHRIRISRVDDWVRVAVANDWSVPWIYALLATAILGLGLAVLAPARRVSVLLVEGEGRASLHVAMWHARRDPQFKARVTRVVDSAANAKESQ